MEKDIILLALAGHSVKVHYGQLVIQTYGSDNCKELKDLGFNILNENYGYGNHSKSVTISR